MSTDDHLCHCNDKIILNGGFFATSTYTNEKAKIFSSDQYLTLII